MGTPHANQPSNQASMHATNHNTHQLPTNRTHTHAGTTAAVAKKTGPGKDDAHATMQAGWQVYPMHV